MRAPASAYSRALKTAGMACRVAKVASWSRRLKKKESVPATSASARLRTSEANAASANKRGECRVNLEDVARLNDFDLKPQCSARRCHVFGHVRGIHIGRIDQQSNARRRRNKLPQQSQLLWSELGKQEARAGHIAARSRQIGNELQLNRILGGEEHDRNGCRRCFGGEGR